MFIYPFLFSCKLIKILAWVLRQCPFHCSYLLCLPSSTLHCNSFVLQNALKLLFILIYLNLHAVNCSKRTTEGDLQVGLTEQLKHQHLVLIFYSEIWRTSYMVFPLFRYAGVDLQREQPLWVQWSFFFLFFFLMTCSACPRAAERTAGVKRVLASF